ncbi:MAG: hypothetical protein II492_02630 [Eubacterium sp.]|nr:hypothetical protein [Eubacterium sp.]MBP3807896.1 hypothetical protein [Eubacterium sp.]MBQ2053862.1 hypothetical protein [Eubacterium sp.]MEE3399255.1 hypothetical protein [Eubacterium sp.]
MVRNIVAVIFVIVFLVELFYATAGSAHRKKRKIKGWNVVTGKIKSMEKVEDPMTHRAVIEMTIKTKNGNTVYAKQSPMFCCYEKGEEVELIEKDGVHRFIGNDRVHKKGVKETIIGTVPFLVMVGIAALISYLSFIWS